MFFIGIFSRKSPSYYGTRSSIKELKQFIRRLSKDWGIKYREFPEFIRNIIGVSSVQLVQFGDYNVYDGSFVCKAGNDIYKIIPKEDIYPRSYLKELIVEEKREKHLIGKVYGFYDVKNPSLIYTYENFD